MVEGEGDGTFKTVVPDGISGKKVVSDPGKEIDAVADTDGVTVKVTVTEAVGETDRDGENNEVDVGVTVWVKENEADGVSDTEELEDIVGVTEKAEDGEEETETRIDVEGVSVGDMVTD